MVSKLLICLLVLCLLCGCAASPALPTQAPSVAPQWEPPESPVTPTDFVQVGDFLQCLSAPAAVGIDVSAHQQEIDWPTVAASGVKYVFVRLGYRGYESGSLNEDSYARKNLERARDAGLQVGAYFFSQAVTEAEAREEAEFALWILDGFSLDLPLVYDWEYVNETARTAQVDRDTLTAMTLAFCRRIEQENLLPMIYFNTSQGRDFLHLEQLQQYPWWLAKYDMAMPFLCEVALWQYTNTGTVPGITGNVDLNLMFADWVK